MIKGINRQIIEVRETDSRFFERALLFVNPSCCEKSDEALRREANRILAQYAEECLPPPSQCTAQKKNSRTRTAVFFILGVALGAVGCAIIRLLFN